MLSATSAGTTIHITRIHTSKLLGARRREVSELAVHAAHMRELLGTLATARTDMAARCVSLLQPLHAKFEQLASAVTSHAVAGTPAAWQEHLLMALACGSLSPAMMQFFGAVNEQQMRRLLKIADSTFASLQEDLLQHLQPAADMCVHRLSQLHALCQW